MEKVACVTLRTPPASTLFPLGREEILQAAELAYYWGIWGISARARVTLLFDSYVVVDALMPTA